MDARQLGGRVRETRTRAGLTQEDLAQRLSLDRTAINKVEAGTRKVTAIELSDIASALGVHMASFFEDPSPAVISHRSSQGLDTTESQIDGLLADIAGEVEFIHSLTSLLISSPDEPWPCPQSDAEAEAMASQARQAIDISPMEPLSDIARRVEQLGLLVFAKDLGRDTADAGSLLLRQGGVCLVNSAYKVGRRRLAVGHELAHYLVADEYTIDWRVAADANRTESRFDRFARALLLPASWLTEEWPRLSEDSGIRGAAVIVASQFRVDMSTLARRLTDLALTDATTAGDVREVRTTQADMIEFDLHPTRELENTVQPRSYQQAVLRLVRDERISRERALDLLWDLLVDEDLPRPRTRTREAGQIWQYVS